MSAFGKCKGGGRRSAARADAPLIATITTTVSSQSAIVVDVSSTGARLRGIDLPASGQDLVISVEGVVAFGEVAWADGPERGVHFESELSPTEEQLLRTKVLEARGLPPEVKAAFDDWALGLAR